MEKEKYIVPTIDVIEFSEEDIITASGGVNLPLDPAKKDN